MLWQYVLYVMIVCELFVVIVYVTHYDNVRGVYCGSMWYTYDNEVYVLTACVVCYDCMWVICCDSTCFTLW